MNGAMQMNQMTADERDALANSRDFQADADTLRRQAARARQPRKGVMLTLAQGFDLKSAGWLSVAHSIVSA